MLPCRTAMLQPWYYLYVPFYSTYFLILATQYSGHLANLHSQTRMTCHSCFRRARLTARSLLMFRSIFFCHFSVFVFGEMFFPQSCPCQKQPSTNTTVLASGQTKSGRPGRATSSFQQGTPALRNNSPSRYSVVRFPALRTRAISSPRVRPPKEVISFRESPGQVLIVMISSNFAVRNCVQYLPSSLFCIARWYSVSNHIAGGFHRICPELVTLWEGL